MSGIVEEEDRLRDDNYDDEVDIAFMRELRKLKEVLNAVTREAKMCSPMCHRETHPSPLPLPNWCPTHHVVTRRYPSSPETFKVRMHYYARGPKTTFTEQAEVWSRWNIGIRQSFPKFNEAMWIQAGCTGRQ